MSLKTAPLINPRSLLRIFVIVLLYFCGTSNAFGQIIDIASKKSWSVHEEAVLIQSPGFDFDNASSRENALAAAQNQSFPKLGHRVVDDNSWVLLVLINSGPKSQSVRIDTGVFAYNGFTAFTETEKLTQVVLKGTFPPVPISERINPEYFLSSSPIIVRTGETVPVWIKLSWGDYLNYGKAELIHESTYNQRRFSHIGKWMFQFGVLITLASFFTCFAILLKSKSAFFYGLFCIGLVGLNLDTQGFAGYLIYPNTQGLHYQILPILQLLIVLTYLCFVVTFTDAKRRFPRLYIASVTIGATAIMLLPLDYILPLGVPIKITYSLAGLFILVSFSAGLLALKHKLKGAKLFAAGVTILFLYSGVGVITAFTSLSFWGNWFQNFQLWGQILDGFVFASAIVAQTFALRKERDDALTTELAISKKNLKIANSLIDAKRDRDRARNLAERNRERLATASHDLRQPLTSLKLALEGVDEDPVDFKPKLRASLDYLNAILGSSLNDTRQDLDDHHGEKALHEPEAVALQMVFENLRRMFSAEAAEKSLELKLEKSSATIEVNVVPLIRVLSNLVSNAIKYTEAGSVTVSSQIDNDYVEISVTDTGAGMDAETLERVMSAYQRGDSGGNGQGLGLSIVSSLAQEQGWTVASDSTPGEGSEFLIGNIPLERYLS